ncbi:MAG: thioredoxin domain-containing protein, partial [Myxococcales bacterium]|nr:thioredoxin domain-containing protein [Myxococcales bacterium]
MASLIRPLAAALVLGLAACAPGGQDGPSGEPGERLATLNGTPIHEADLDAWIREELFADATEGKDESALFEWRSEALERMIDDQLLAAEAEARGIEVAELREQAVSDIAISDQEVQTFYEANRARVGQATLEDLAPRIRDFLTQQTRAQEWSRFVSGLREAATIEIALEPPRVDVEAVGPAKGPAQAPITIVEFSDFNCPFCQRVNPTLAELERRYAGQVRIVFRHYPLDQLHPRARAIAEASVCADEQGRFWEFHDAVFADGSAMSDEAIRGTAEA